MERNQDISRVLSFTKEVVLRVIQGTLPYFMNILYQIIAEKRRIDFKDNYICWKVTTRSCFRNLKPHRRWLKVILCQKHRPSYVDLKQSPTYITRPRHGHPFSRSSPASCHCADLRKLSRAWQTAVDFPRCLFDLYWLRWSLSFLSCYTDIRCPSPLLIHHCIASDFATDFLSIRGDRVVL